MHASDPPDVSLLQRIVARDTAALAELYDRHSRFLFGLILRIVHDRPEAEEILQEAFVRVWARGGAALHSTRSRWADASAQRSRRRTSTARKRSYWMLSGARR